MPLQIKRVPISSLSEDPANARQHGDRNMEAIKGSLRRFGQQKPIVVTKDGIIVAGNGTFRAAKELGWQEIDIVETALSPTEITAFAIADNRSSELAFWDSNTLSGLVLGLNESGYDVTGLGFDDYEISSLLKNSWNQKIAYPDPGPTPEPTIEPPAPLDAHPMISCPKCGENFERPPSK